MPLDDYVSTSAPVGQSATSATPRSGKKTANILKDKAVILVNPDYKEVIERVIDLQQRRKRSVQMKRLSPRLQRSREIARTRMASPKQLERRAYRTAKSGIRKRFAGPRGSEYQDLSASGKYAVDTLIDPKVKDIKQLVQKILPRIRQSDSRRVQAARTHTKYQAVTVPMFNSVDLTVDDFNKLWEQFFGEEKTLKNTNPCWTGYKPVGTKKMKGRTVPNCVPEQVNRDLNESFGAFYLAKDLGIVAEGGFSMHPSVQVMLDEDAANHLRQASIAARAGKNMKADLHRKIATALQNGDTTTASALKNQLERTDR